MYIELDCSVVAIIAITAISVVGMLLERGNNKGK